MGYVMAVMFGVALGILIERTLVWRNSEREEQRQELASEPWRKGCTCGYGGMHHDLRNPQCALNSASRGREAEKMLYELADDELIDRQVVDVRLAAHTSPPPETKR